MMRQDEDAGTTNQGPRNPRGMARKSESPPSTRAGLLRIGEIARRAGVARGTVQHYLREGLLPEPVKTHRNMAYYQPECVERIRLIKELQHKSYLPLHEIRELLGSGRQGGTLAQAVMHAQEAALATITPAAKTGALSIAEAAKQFGLRRGLLDELVRLDILTLRPSEPGDRGEPVFSGADLEVLAALAKLRDLGFTERRGFSAGDVSIYREALEALLHKELQTFMRVLAGKQGGKATQELARSATDGATMLLVALRKKMIIDLLASVSSELPAIFPR